MEKRIRIAWISILQALAIASIVAGHIDLNGNLNPNHPTFYRSSGGKNAKNSRIDSLISILGSNPERLYSVGGLKGIDSVVDWVKVDHNLSILRENSITFLKEALK